MEILTFVDFYFQRIWMDALLLPSNEVVSWVFSMGDTDTLCLIDGPFFLPIFPSDSFGMDHGSLRSGFMTLG